MKRAIVTGANGFVGSAVCRSLAAHGTDIIAVVRDESSDLSKLKDIDGLSIVYCDMSKYDELCDAISEPVDVFFHFAWNGCSGPKRSDYALQLKNAEYSCDAIKLCQRLSCKRFVFAASIMEYEVRQALDTDINPGINAVYSQAKASADDLLRIMSANMGIEYLSCIISNIYGPGETSPRLVNTTIRKLLKGEHCAFSEGKQLYDFIYISDAAEMFYYVAESGTGGKRYYIGNKEVKTLRSFLEIIKDVVDEKAVMGYGEFPFAGPYLDYGRIDTGAVERDTGFVPEVSFTAGIEKTTEWIKQNV